MLFADILSWLGIRIHVLYIVIGIAAYCHLDKIQQLANTIIPFLVIRSRQSHRLSILDSQFSSVLVVVRG